MQLTMAFKTFGVFTKARMAGKSGEPLAGKATELLIRSAHCYTRIFIGAGSYPFCNPIFAIPESFSFNSPQPSTTKKSISSMSNKAATYFTEFPPNWLDAPLDSPNDQVSYADIPQALHD